MGIYNKPAHPAPVEGTASTLIAYLDLLHLLPVALTVLAAAGFAVIATHGRPPGARLALLLTSVLLTQFAISIHNDYCDLDLDAKAKPRRAIPSGLVAPAAALRWSLTLALLGLLVNVPLGMMVMVLALVGTAAGFIYNMALKRGPWSWLPFWVGFPTLVLWSFAAMSRLEARLWSIYLIGLPLVLAIHLADTLPDLETDSALGVHGLAHHLGPKRTRLACWASLALAIVLALVLEPTRHLPWPLYLTPAALLAAAILFGARDHLRLHWLAVMAGAALVAFAWLIRLT